MNPVSASKANQTRAQIKRRCERKISSLILPSKEGLCRDILAARTIDEPLETLELSNAFCYTEIMHELLVKQNLLQQEAEKLLKDTAILEFLNQLGKPIQTGSSVTGLMVYPDIDFSVQNDNYNIKDVISLTNLLFERLGVTAFKIADFDSDTSEDAGYYLGFELPYNEKTWHIDATITKSGAIVTNPPEMQNWIDTMTDDERLTILDLKKQLIDAKRYIGARSQPPYTFRSSHLYEGVLKGKAKTITDLENYFKKST